MGMIHNDSPEHAAEFQSKQLTTIYIFCTDLIKFSYIQYLICFETKDGGEVYIYILFVLIRWMGK